MELPGLSVIEAVRPPPEEQAGAASTGAADDQEVVTSIRELRRGYRDFALVSPVAEETYWGTGGQVPLYASGPGVDDFPILIEQTDIFHIAASHLGLTDSWPR